MKLFIKKIFQPVYILPLAVFILSKVLAYIIAHLGNCHGALQDCWSRWDSGIYLQMVSDGRTFYQDADGSWSGFAGWMPLYPILMGIISKISGISLVHAGIFLSSLFFYFYLVMVAKLQNTLNYHWKSFFAIMLAAIVPGNIYYHAIFPLSLVAFLIALVIFYVKQEKYLSAGLAAGVATISYSIGFIFILAAVTYILFQKIIWKNPTKTIYFLAITPMLFFVCVLFRDWLVLGHWDAIFLIQKKYGHDLQNPLHVLGEYLQKLKTSLDKRELLFGNYLQNIFLCFYFILLASWNTWQSLKQKNAVSIFSTILALFFWFLPFSLGTNVGLYRNVGVIGATHTVLLPYPLFFRILTFFIFGIFALKIGILFIHSTII